MKATAGYGFLFTYPRIYRMFGPLSITVELHLYFFYCPILIFHFHSCCVLNSKEYTGYAEVSQLSLATL